MKHYLKEVESCLRALPQRTSHHNPESYIGGGQSKLEYLGLRTPHLRDVLKSGFSFSQEPGNEQSEIWDYIWRRSNTFEVMALALSWFYHPHRRPLLKSHWRQLKHWSLRVDNWAHSDTLSGIYARLLEDHPPLIYPTLLKWNVSRNPWLRRLSIVSLLYYSSQRKKAPALNQILPLVTTRLEDPHYYVQKAVGWTLRETYNLYPKSTYVYLLKNVRILSSHAFSAATEKMSKAEKENLKKHRRKKTISAAKPN